MNNFILTLATLAMAAHSAVAIKTPERHKDPSQPQATGVSDLGGHNDTADRTPPAAPLEAQHTKHLQFDGARTIPEPRLVYAIVVLGAASLGAMYMRRRGREEKKPARDQLKQTCPL